MTQRDAPAAAPAGETFRRGVSLFNSGEFWLAHEAWEEIWLRSSGETKLFLQGLIQLAAAYHHVKRGTLRGAPRLFDAALQKLSRFPAGYAALDRSAAEEAARRHRGILAGGEIVDPREFPALVLLKSDDDGIPSSDDW